MIYSEYTVLYDENDLEEKETKACIDLTKIIAFSAIDEGTEIVMQSGQVYLIAMPYLHFKEDYFNNLMINDSVKKNTLTSSEYEDVM